MKQKISPLEAFNGVFKLFTIYYEEKGSGTIQTSMGNSLDAHSGNISIMLGTMDFDEGMWEIWLESVDTVLDEVGIDCRNSLTLLQAFKAIPLYLEGFYGVDLFDDITYLVINCRLIIMDASLDDPLWKQWVQCIDEVISAGNIEYQGRIHKDYFDNLTDVSFKNKKYCLDIEENQQDKNIAVQASTKQQYNRWNYVLVVICIYFIKVFILIK